VRRLVFAGLAVLAVLVAVIAWRLLGPDASAPAAKAKGAGMGGAGRPIPVTIVPAARRDMPIYLDGLGTVQAYKTVTVHSRIDGQLVSVDFKEGQDVKAGDPLAHLDERTYRAQFDQAAATRDKDQAQLEAAKRDLDRYIGLKDRVTGQSVDTQRALVKQLEATVRADQAAVENARTMLSYTVITASFDGRTGIRQVDEGNIVHASDSSGLVVLTQVQPISVLFTLPQQDLPLIMRQTETLPVLAMAADGKTLIDRGQLELVDNQIDSTTGTIRLKAVMPNAERRLWPGGFVNVRLLVTTVKDGIVVPAPAVQRGPQGSYAFVVKDDKTVEMRALKVTQVEADVALIAEGLAEGERVVSEGAGKLQAGARVADAADRAARQRGDAEPPAPEGKPAGPPP